MERLDRNLMVQLNRQTLYPEIPLYHKTKLGRALEELQVPFTADDEVYCTEKLEGRQGRIILWGKDDWFVADQESILAAKGDRGILSEPEAVLASVASRLVRDPDCPVMVYYFVVCGAKVGGCWQRYTEDVGMVRLFLFDISRCSWFMPDSSPPPVFQFLAVPALQRMAQGSDLALVPCCTSLPGDLVPKELSKVLPWMARVTARRTRARFGYPAILDINEVPDMVLRTFDRSKLALLRASTYEGGT